jgi:hypothetical protein
MNTAVLQNTFMAASWDAIETDKKQFKKYAKTSTLSNYNVPLPFQR